MLSKTPQRLLGRRGVLALDLHARQICHFSCGHFVSLLELIDTTYTVGARGLATPEILSFGRSWPQMWPRPVKKYDPWRMARSKPPTPKGYTAGDRVSRVIDT